MFSGDLRLAWRRFLRNPGFTAAAVLTLAQLLKKPVPPPLKEGSKALQDEEERGTAEVEFLARSGKLDEARTAVAKVPDEQVRFRRRYFAQALHGSQVRHHGRERFLVAVLPPAQFLNYIITTRVADEVIAA